MSRERKTITDNPIIDELVYNGQQLIHGVILKDEEEANSYETLETIKQSDIFMAIKEDRLVFSSFKYTRSMLSIIDDFTSEELDYYALNNADIPEKYREKLLKNAETLFLDNYEEKNNYYRRLNGFPDYGESGLYITPNDVGGISGDIWKTISATKNKPIHEWTSNYLNIVQTSEYFDSIKEAHPDLKYLNFLGEYAIDIYQARKAEHLECLYIPSCESSSVRNRFTELLEKNREVFLKTIYSDAYKFDSDYYNKFMIIMIILQSFNDLIGEAPLYVIRRDFWDYRSIQYLFEANGMTYFRDIPLKYQLNFVSNINRLIKFKSTDQNIVDICSLFGFDSLQLFKYYILKDRTIRGGDYSYKETVTNYWTPSALPSISKWINVVYANGKYFALGKNVIAVSEDAANWKACTINTNITTMAYEWSSVVYGNGVYIATSNLVTTNPYEYILLFSYDGITWEQVRLYNTNKQLVSSCYDNMIFVNGRFVTTSGAYSFTSVSGRTWELSQITAPANIYLIKSLIYSDNKYIAFQESGQIYTSNSDLTEFTQTSDLNGYSVKWKKLVLLNGKYYAISNGPKNDIIVCSKDLTKWTLLELPESRFWADICYGKGTFVLTPYCNILGESAIKTYYSDDDCKTWTEVDLHKQSYWNGCCYGNGKFVTVSGDFYSSNATAYFKYNTELVSESDSKYNNTENYQLKFIKTAIDGNVIESLLNPSSVYEYFPVIQQDQYWEGDYDRNEVVQNILDHDFNILRTKYYSIESVTELTEMSFKLSYFMNIIMNTELSDSLTLPLPFISSAKEFRIIDVFVLLYVLGYEYYGVTDNIMNVGSEVLTIRSFNFEADLTYLQNYLAEKGYDLYNLCGDKDFAVPESIGTYKQLMYVFNNNKAIYEHITEQMINANDKNIYDIYKKIYDALFIADLNMSNFSAKDTNGNIIYTYSTFTSYLFANDLILYNYILSIRSITNDQEKIDTITAAMNDITSYVEEYTILDEELGHIEYLWSGLPTLSMDFVKQYLSEMINFFKSFKAHILSVNTIYKFTDRFENLMYWIDRVHFDYRFDKAEIIHIYESIYNSVTLKYKEKVEIIELMDKALYSLVELSKEEKIEIIDKYSLLSVFEKEDYFGADENIVSWLTSKILDEEVYVSDNFLRKFFTSKKDSVSFNSVMKYRSVYPNNEMSRSITYKD